jgi:hypothetical protein
MNVLKKLKTKETQTKIVKYFILFGYLPIGILVGLFTPNDILTHPWARSYTDFMAKWLPYVAEVGRWTPVPATEFIAAVMNLVAIFVSISLMYVELKYYLEEILKRLNDLSKKKKILALFLYIPFFICAAYIVLFLAPINHPPGRRDRIMIGSNLGMGIYGSLIIAGGWVAIAATIMIVILLFIMLKRRLGRNNI